MTKVAVILSGCGVFDGSEIYESTLTLLALDQAGAQYQCMAPDIEQMHVINHLTGQEMHEKRNVLIEAARLARGAIISLGDAVPSDYDAVIVPGGFGAAKNLSDFAVKGANMSVSQSVKSFIQTMHEAGKPIGLICIAPAMAPKLFGKGIVCTIGNDQATAAAIEAMGGIHQVCPIDECVVDRQRKVVTTPAYMLEGRISEVAAGINKLVTEVLALS